MLGWQVFVIKGNEKIASWTTGVSGIDWLQDLVKDGKAKELDANSGYPYALSVSASVFWPFTYSGIPEGADGTVIGDDYVAPIGKNWNISFDKDKLLGCKPDDELIIEAWDQS